MCLRGVKGLEFGVRVWAFGMTIRRLGAEGFWDS